MPLRPVQPLCDSTIETRGMYNPLSVGSGNENHNEYGQAEKAKDAVRRNISL